MPPCPKCFLGKSNVGKSSLLNALLQNEIAVSSASAGRTRHMFQFDVGKHFSIVDLPGYGENASTKIAASMRGEWRDLIEGYLGGGEVTGGLKPKVCVCLLEAGENTLPLPSGTHDSRPTNSMFPRNSSPDAEDEEFWDMIHPSTTRLLVVTKIDAQLNDKRRLHQYMATLCGKVGGEVATLYQDSNVSPYVHTVSAVKGFGIKELRAHIATLLLNPNAQKER